MVYQMLKNKIDDIPDDLKTFTKLKKKKKYGLGLAYQNKQVTGEKINSKRHH